MIWSLGAPSGGLMNCALAKLCHQIKRDKYKIVLDGTGLDEGFGGYELHHLKYLAKFTNGNKKKFNFALKLFCENWKISEQKILDKLNSLQNIVPKTIDGYDLVNSKLISESFSKDFSDNFEFQKKMDYMLALVIQ